MFHFSFHSDGVSKLRSETGQDPIIGSLPVCTTAQFTGTAPTYKTGDVVDIQLTGANDTKIEVSGLTNVTAAGVLPSPSEPDTRFINSRGGEYFFVPSISTLKAGLALWFLRNRNGKTPPAFRNWHTDGPLTGMSCLLIQTTVA